MEFLPEDLLKRLRDANGRGRTRRSRLRVHTGPNILPILRQWDGGFALDAAKTTTLRGLVDIYEGSRHLSSCLIVASEIDGGELICTVKRETIVMDHAPLDFARDESAPRGFLPRLV